MRIIGCGNRERGDDGVGPFVADRLRDLGVDAQPYTGDALGLIDQWSEADDVVVVDAVVTGAQAGVVYLWNGRRGWPTDVPPLSGHGFDVAQAIELARLLDRLPPRLQMCGIEGRHFALGGEISHPVRKAGEAVVDWLVTMASRSRVKEVQAGGHGEHRRSRHCSAYSPSFG